MRTIRAIATPVPHEMSVENNYQEVASWISGQRVRFSNAILHAKQRRELGLSPPKPSRQSFADYSDIQSMTPATALVLASEYDRAQALSGAKLGVYGLNKWKPEVKRLLSEIGFFRLLGIESPDLLPENSHIYVTIERFESGSKLDPEKIAELVNQLIPKVYRLAPEAITDMDRRKNTAQMFSALIEAIENTRQHAYPKSGGQGAKLLPKWWLTGAAYPDERRLTLVVYDQGVSIPASVGSLHNAAWPGNNRVIRALKKLVGDSYKLDDPMLDAAKIRLAVQYGKSSTQQAHRGKGLHAIRDAIEHCPEGRLRIISRQGEYLIKRGKKPTSTNLGVQLAGTLIIWDFWL